MKDSENKGNIKTSSIDNLLVDLKDDMNFQNITVLNSVISGECKLYKDNTHVANIVFQLKK